MSQASPQSGNTLKVLWHLTMNRIKGNTHEERLESFYAGQADAYDDFRKKLLHGREEMFTSIPNAAGSTWVDLGAGTGSNAEYLGDKLANFGKVYQVDLCSPLLEVGKKRIEHRGWKNVETVHADATKFVPPEGQVDVVTFSYSLTMIPDWFRAVDHAYSLLKPGGTIGIVDFYVARKYAAEGHKKHGWSTRTFWQIWFGNDNVYLNPDHLPYIKNKFDTVKFEERFGSVPFIPLVKAPYYIFIGRKPEATRIGSPYDSSRVGSAYQGESTNSPQHPEPTLPDQSKINPVIIDPEQHRL
jgi:S-adenosylmethionine-diacylgycerolhomoserine-N-methlytransferase